MSDLQTLLDRLALQDLVARYARAVDQLDIDLVLSLFQPDATFTLYTTDPSAGEPQIDLTGHEQIGGLISSLEQWGGTTHFLGQQVVELNGDEATGELYAIAHHLDRSGSEPANMVMGLRYQDQYERTDEGWRFAGRTLIADWQGRQAVQPLAWARRGS